MIKAKSFVLKEFANLGVTGGALSNNLHNTIFIKIRISQHIFAQTLMIYTNKQAPVFTKYVTHDPDKKILFLCFHTSKNKQWQFGLTHKKIRK